MPVEPPLKRPVAVLALLVALMLASPTSRARPQQGGLPPFRGGLPISRQASGELEPGSAPPVGPPETWRDFTIFVWQYRTDVRLDLELYRRAGFGAFHVDRGAGREQLVEFARREGLPYYVDHAADKGFLHLTPRTGRDELPDDGSIAPRPFSLADPGTLDRMKRELTANIAVTRQGPAAAYAFDDEISLGSFTSPIEVDASPASIASYRRWLEAEYGTIEALNATWGTDHRSFDEVDPQPFGSVREANDAPPLSGWDLAPWMDWRSYNDRLFAAVLAELTRHANALDPTRPAGFVGGQQPAPYGGFDYSKVAPAVQWAECYDIGGTNEILRSFWGWPERRPRVQTWFSRGDARVDSWFLWYCLLHGNRGVIAWPDRGGDPWFRPGGRPEIDPAIAANAGTIREVQGLVSRAILDPSASFDADPIAVLYSHPSVQASWAMDVTTHGRTWPRRSSGLDNACQSAGKNRVSWFRLLEDCGFQYDVVDAGQVDRGDLIDRGYRVLILGRAPALSDETCEAIRGFVEAGGTVIADHLTALLTDRGVGRPGGGGLDDLFGIRRDESLGYFDGRTLAEIDGERHRAPFLDRLRYDPSMTIDGLAVVERGTTATAGAAARRVGSADVVIDRRLEAGRTVYLNLSTVAYFDASYRLGAPGQAWRDRLSGLLAGSGLKPRARVLDEAGAPVPMAEVVFWRRGDRLVLGVVKNPTRQGSISDLGEVAGLDGDPIEVTLELAFEARSAVDLRTGLRLPDGRSLRSRWRPWEAMLFEMDAPGADD